MSEVTVIKKIDIQVDIFLIASFLCEFNILTNAGQLMQSLPSSSTLQGPLGGISVDARNMQSLSDNIRISSAF